MAKKSETKNEAQPITCIACGVGQLQRQGELPPTEYAGQLPDGKSYNTVHRIHYRCSECQHPRIILEYR